MNNTTAKVIHLVDVENTDTRIKISIPKDENKPPYGGGDELYEFTVIGAWVVLTVRTVKYAQHKEPRIYSFSLTCDEHADRPVGVLCRFHKLLLKYLHNVQVEGHPNIQKHIGELHNWF